MIALWSAMRLNQKGVSIWLQLDSLACKSKIGKTRLISSDSTIPLL